MLKTQSFQHFEWHFCSFWALAHCDFFV